MAQILNPTNGYRGELAKQGIKPKNHMAANRAALKKTAQDFRDNEDKKSVTKERFVLKQFQNVDSRVKRPSTATQRPGSARESAAGAAAMNSARARNTQVVFGKNFESASNAPKSNLNSANLKKFDKKQSSNSVSGRQQPAFDTQAVPDEQQENR